MFEYSIAFMDRSLHALTCYVTQSLTYTKQEKFTTQKAPYADVNEPALGEELLEGLNRVVATPEHCGRHGHAAANTKRPHLSHNRLVIITVGIYLSFI